VKNQIIIEDEELKNILPPLTKDELGALEQEILKSGMLNPILTWRGVIVDGYNRYSICQKHSIPFEYKELEFDDKEEAMLWMINNQLGRRNLSDYSKCELVLKMKPILAERARERMLSGRNPTPNSAEGGEVRDQLAKLAGVGHDTLSKVEEIDAAASDEIKEKARSGKITINAAHKCLKTPSDKPCKKKEHAEPTLRSSIRKLKAVVDNICDDWDDLSEKELDEVKSITDLLQDHLQVSKEPLQTSQEALESTIAC